MKHGAGEDMTCYCKWHLEGIDSVSATLHSGVLSSYVSMNALHLSGMEMFWISVNPR